MFTFLRQEDDQEDDIEHLALMERLLQESLPLELLDSADPKRAAKLVLKQDNGSRLGWPEWARAAESLRHVERQPSSLSSLVLPRHEGLTSFVEELRRRSRNDYLLRKFVYGGP